MIVEAINRKKIPIEIADFTGESEEANLESHYFVLPKDFISKRANQEKFLGLLGTMMDEGYVNRFHSGGIPLPIDRSISIIKDEHKTISDKLGSLTSASKGSKKSSVTSQQYFTVAAGRYNLKFKEKLLLGG